MMKINYLRAIWSGVLWGAKACWSATDDQARLIVQTWTWIAVGNRRHGCSCTRACTCVTIRTVW